MLRIVLVLLLFVAIIRAVDMNYIIRFKPPVTKETYKTARADVEAAGGKVLYEFHNLVKSILVSLPNTNTISTLSAKPYVAYVEEDKAVI
ncbi:hypothetical protein BDB01DRAFT_596120 [Pilobolus umbonatus]|nr:hypothetical protein BDB01DRAFT_596120 [Pilobolus umbonatus]